MLQSNQRQASRKPPLVGRFGDEARFLRSWLERPLVTGAVSPSGKMLARMMACYVDSVSSRSLPNSVSLSASGGSGNATIGNCMDACAASGYLYCGEEYYSECYGSNTAPTAQVAPGSDPLSAGCNFPCNGNKTEACGGANRVLVYINNGTSS